MWQASRKNSLQYITSGHKTTTILVVFFRKDWDTVLLVRLLGGLPHDWAEHGVTSYWLSYLQILIQKFAQPIGMAVTC